MEKAKLSNSLGFLFFKGVISIKRAAIKESVEEHK